MEMTWEQWKIMNKALRRRFSTIGWILLVYYAIMNVAVFFCVFIETIVKMMMELQSGSFDALMNIAMESADSAWGYFLAAAVGILILLSWKKPRYWRGENWAKGILRHTFTMAKDGRMNGNYGQQQNALFLFHKSYVTFRYLHT